MMIKRICCTLHARSLAIIGTVIFQLFALCSCSDRNLVIAQEEADAYVGHSKQELIECMGIAGQKKNDSGVEIWSYSNHNGAEDFCTANFLFKNRSNVVSSVNLKFYEMVAIGTGRMCKVLLAKCADYFKASSSPTTIAAPAASTPAVAGQYEDAMAANRRGDYVTALRLIRPLADQGNASAQNNLGTMYSNGQGVTKDYAEAMRWFRKAANQGYALAQYNIADMYANGHGVPQNPFEAAKWYLKAADQGDSVSQYNLAAMYATGNGVPQNHAEAAKWVRRAADQGYARAQHNLGGLYVTGEGVPQDDAEAMKWFRKAANQGYAPAQFILGVIYDKGLGIPKDNAEAVRWYRKAAEQGDADARKQLDALGQPPSSIPLPASPTSPRFATSPLALTFPHSPQRPDDIAVIIGNADYSKGRDIPDARTAYADAESVRRYVIDGLGVREGNVIFIKDATGSQLTEVFGNERDHKGKVFNWVKPGKSRVFVYYIGHGAPGSAEGRAMLVPSDASAGQIALSGYPLDLLYANLGKVPAENITVVLDACFSGVSPAGSIMGNALPLAIVARVAPVPPNVTVISAAASDQMANWEQDNSHAMFTEYYLKGMSGEADKAPYGNGDGKVSLDELARYLKATMSYMVRRNYGRDQTAQIIQGHNN